MLITIAHQSLLPHTTLFGLSETNTPYCHSIPPFA